MIAMPAPRSGSGALESRADYTPKSAGGVAQQGEGSDSMGERIGCGCIVRMNAVPSW